METQYNNRRNSNIQKRFKKLGSALKSFRYIEADEEKIRTCFKELMKLQYKNNPTKLDERKNVSKYYERIDINLKKDHNTRRCDV